LLAGEVVNADQGGLCASMNSIIATLPNTLPNSYIISSKACTDGADNIHFNSAGYRELGKRYAMQMLSLLGYDTTDLHYPEIPMVLQGIDTIYFEAECATVGRDWNILENTTASNEKYVIVRPDTESVLTAPADSAGSIYFPFTIKSAGNYKLFGRVNCPGATDDSFWVKMDNGEFVMSNGLTTVAWQWKQLSNYSLTKGNHTLIIGFRENGAKLDKLCIANYASTPTEMGEEAENICTDDPSTIRINLTETSGGYSLDQNYPNPFSGKTSISFRIPDKSFVSLKVFNILGVEIAEVAGNEFDPGHHILEFNTGKLSKGIYFYRITADRFCAARNMIIEGME
jgi:hypothetical protein